MIEHLLGTFIALDELVKYESTRELKSLQSYLCEDTYLGTEEAIREARDLAHWISLVVRMERHDRLWEALVDTINDGTMVRRAGVVFWIRACATMDKDGNADAVSALISHLKVIESSFGALSEKPDFVAQWLGRVYGKGGRKIQPEYCASVLSIDTGAFGDKPSPLSNSRAEDHRAKAKDYTAAVGDYNAKNAPPPPTPPPNVYEASDHHEMLRRAIIAGWLNRGQAFDVSEGPDGHEKLTPKQVWADLTIEALRAALAQHEAAVEARRGRAFGVPFVGARGPSSREQKNTAKTAGKSRPGTS